VIADFKPHQKKGFVVGPNMRLLPMQPSDRKKYHDLMEEHIHALIELSEFLWIDGDVRDKIRDLELDLFTIKNGGTIS